MAIALVLSLSLDLEYFLYIIHGQKSLRPGHKWIVENEGQRNREEGELSYPLSPINGAKEKKKDEKKCEAEK